MADPTIGEQVFDEAYGNDRCAVCGRALKQHFDMKGHVGRGAWCSTASDDLRHFISPHAGTISEAKP